MNELRRRERVVSSAIVKKCVEEGRDWGVQVPGGAVPLTPAASNAAVPPPEPGCAPDIRRSAV
jgi:hypothetical protein